MNTTDDINEDEYSACYEKESAKVHKLLEKQQTDSEYSGRLDGILGALVGHSVDNGIISDLFDNLYNYCKIEGVDAEALMRQVAVQNKNPELY